MRKRFRPGNFKRRYFPPNNSSKKVDQDLLWAITAGRSLNATAPDPVQVNYKPENKFEDFPILDTIKRNVLGKNFVFPTPIQDKAIGAILAGFDIIGIANTGTGKTAAFLIPLLDKVARDHTQKVLIVAPTRELALQISTELKDFARGLNITSALCIGGVNINRQKFELSKNPAFVIGTPGRIKDLVGQRRLNMGQFGNVVLDEADRMVDIGFIGDIKYLISLLPMKRQSLFFSATISGKVKEVLGGFVKNPVTISVKVRETIDNIKQEVVRVARDDHKVDKLHDLLIQNGFDKVLVFGRTKRGIQRLSNELASRGFKTAAIHGDKSQGQRQKALDMFRNNQIRILLATDVASRGLDIADVSHVINYDLPASYDDYIHRIGRTGRANKIGTALTFV